MTQPNNQKLDMDGCQRFIEAIRFITGNPTLDKQQCEEWIERIKDVKDRYPYTTAITIPCKYNMG